MALSFIRAPHVLELSMPAVHISAIPETSILEQCRGLPERRFEAGSVLLTEGETTGLLIVLAEGEVEIVKGGYRINTVAEPGAIFGEISLLLEKPHMATVRATGPVRAYVAEGGASFLRAHPEIATELSRLLAQRLHGLSTYLVDLKRQFEHRADHLGIVDDVLETLAHQQRTSFTPGSDRDPEMPEM
jgi:CRP-like cAMP-binding protein